MVRTRSPIPNLRHLNDDCLGVVSIKTTGLDYKKHDLLQVAILISDDYFTPYKVAPFYMKLKPQFPDTAKINKRLIDDSLKNGYDCHTATNAFDLWFAGLGLLRLKQIQLLGDNVSWQLGFLREWLGETSVNQYFSPKIRDLGSAARFLNDRACMTNAQYPVSKYGLSYMCSSLGVVNDMKGNSLHDAIATLEVYRRLVGTQV